MTGVRLLLTLNSTGDGRGRLGDQFTTASVLQSAWTLNGLNKNQIDLTASTRARLLARGHSPCSRGCLEREIRAGRQCDGAGRLIPLHAVI